MEMYTLILAFVWSNLWYTSCVPRKRKNDSNRKFHRTGEPIALDDLIQNFEREHQKFYEKESKGGDHLEWPALDDKNISYYCRKYLQYSIPGRNTDNATGIKVKTTLHYAKENTNIAHDVVVVQCRVLFKSHHLACYITRAPEPNCVYALKSAGTRIDFILTIIHKHCDFEGEKINNSLKRKRDEIISKIHTRTGQPIATDEYLLKYEVEHQELSSKEGVRGECIEWSLTIEKPNLDSYCYQYIRGCVPHRNREGTTGYWRVEKLHYEKLDTNVEIRVKVVTCQVGHVSKRHYHITRALETNCVYALLRKGRGAADSMVIIFKHCDFQEPNDQQVFSQSHDNIDTNIIPKTEPKEEISDTLEPLQFLQLFQDD